MRHRHHRRLNVLRALQGFLKIEESYLSEQKLEGYSIQNRRPFRARPSFLFCYAKALLTIACGSLEGGTVE